MSTIYLATTGSYLSYRVVAAFTREEDAAAYPLADQVEPIELRDGPADVRDLFTLHWCTWRPDKPDGQPKPYSVGNPYVVTHRADRADHPARPQAEWRRHAFGLMLEVAAWTDAEARQVYGDERAMHLADPENYPPNQAHLRPTA